MKVLGEFVNVGMISIEHSIQHHHIGLQMALSALVSQSVPISPLSWSVFFLLGNMRFAGLGLESSRIFLEWASFCHISRPPKIFSIYFSDIRCGPQTVGFFGLPLRPRLGTQYSRL